MDIFKAHHFYVPFFEIKLGDKKLDDLVKRDVLQVIYRDSLDAIDTFEITLNNWNPKETGKSTAKYIGPGLKKDEESIIFEPGKKVEVFMGYYEAHVPDTKPQIQRQMLVGEITSLAVNLPASGQPTLRVSGQNILRKLLTKQETHDYENKTDTQIAQQIFDRGNLPFVKRPLRTQPDTRREASRDFVKQDNQFDIVFMMSLARHSGYDLVLREVPTKGKSEYELFFGASELEGSKPKDRLTDFTLEWGKSLIQFQPILTILQQVGSVTVRGWNPVTKKPIVGKATLKDLDKKILNDLKRQNRLEGTFSDREEIIVDKPIRTQDEANKFAKAKLQELAKQMVTCSGTTVGYPDLRTGVEVELKELGPTFCGHYIITSTTHTIGSNGYQTEFQARKEKPCEEER